MPGAFMSGRGLAISVKSTSSRSCHRAFRKVSIADLEVLDLLRKSLSRRKTPKNGRFSGRTCSIVDFEIPHSGIMAISVTKIKEDMLC